MKTCVAGHDLIAFGAARCPLCIQIERSDKETLKLQIMLEDLRRINTKLTNAQVSNVNAMNVEIEELENQLRIARTCYDSEIKKEGAPPTILDWNGGAT